MTNEPVVSIEESDLIHRLLLRQENAWRQFVQQYQRLIFSQVIRTAARFSVSLSNAEAEDICSQVFSALLKNDMSSLRSFDGRSRISTWLVVVSRRISAREIQKRQAETPKVALEETLPDQNVDALSQLIQGEDQHRLKATLNTMEDADKEILQLYYEQNMSYREISRLLGISQNTVGPKLTRAHDRLRKRMRWS